MEDQNQTPAAPAVQAPPANPTPPKSSSKMPIIIIALLIVIIIFLGGYFVMNEVSKKDQAQVPNPTPVEKLQNESTPTPVDETANWKTYSTQANFSFKYPSTFMEINGVIQSPDHKLTTEGIETLETGIELSVLARPTTETSIDKMYETDRFAGQIESSKSITTVAGEKAIRYDYSYENTQATNTVFIHNGVYYWVKLRWADSKTKQEYIKTYGQIISTFKFTTNP